MHKKQIISITRLAFGFVVTAIAAVFIYIILPDKHKSSSDFPSTISASADNSSISNDLPPTPTKSYDICIDPGHGGNDIGSSNKERLEKDDTLRLSLAVYDYLVSKNISVCLTRSTDSYLSLEERKNYAEVSNCKLLISIHRNLYENSAKINGAECWIHSSNPVNANQLASSILTELCDEDNFPSGTFDNRGVKTGTVTDIYDDYALNKVSMTSMILEMGFISSHYDNKVYDNNLDSYARIIGDNIINYINFQ